MAAERALSRRPDLAARINLAFASVSTPPAVVTTPLASSLRFVHPAPQYAYRGPHGNDMGVTPKGAIHTVRQFIAERSPRAPTTPHGELLGYVEVDAW